MQRTNGIGIRRRVAREMRRELQQDWEALCMVPIRSCYSHKKAVGEPYWKVVEGAIVEGEVRFTGEAKGDTSTIVWLNGEQVSRYTSEKYREPAPIGLQIHPGLVMKVEFCDLRAKAL